jgi:hypothetical protein
VSGQTARRRTVLLRTAKSCGPDASTPASSLAEVLRARPGGQANIREATVTRKPDRRGEHEISRKPLRAGMPGDFRCDRCEYSCAFELPYAHTRLRVHWAPGIPHALRGGSGTHNSGASRRGMFLAVLRLNPSRHRKWARQMPIGVRNLTLILRCSKVKSPCERDSGISAGFSVLVPPTYNIEGGAG